MPTELKIVLQLIVAIIGVWAFLNIITVGRISDLFTSRFWLEGPGPE